MKERPIIFNADMVKAILRGQKTQTRRPVVPQPVRLPAPNSNYWEWDYNGHGYRHVCRWVEDFFPVGMPSDCPFGQPGDRLWVRETFAELPQLDGPLFPTDVEYMLAGTPFRWRVKWKPSIHMPRRLARVFLEITEVRVERVQKITVPEALAEGMHASQPAQSTVVAFQKPGIPSTQSAASAGTRIPGCGSSNSSRRQHDRPPCRRTLCRALRCSP